MLNGVVFDAFGTLCEIKLRLNPYRQLLAIGAAQGRKPVPADIRRLMAEPLSLAGAAQALGIEVSPVDLESLQAALSRELASIVPFPEAYEAVCMLQREGLRVGICSNLSMPYGPIVEALFPSMDTYAFSYERGVLKPDPEIYRSICGSLLVYPGAVVGTAAEQVAMIGDSPKCDRDGPQAAGMLGFHLNRKHGPLRDLIQFAEHVIKSRQA